MRNARSSVDDAPSRSPWATRVRAWVTSDWVDGERRFSREGAGGLGAGALGDDRKDDGEPLDKGLGNGELGGGGRGAGAGQPLSSAAAVSVAASFSERCA